MKNQSVSDFVAQAMDVTLNSPEHKALFNTYKTAADKCGKCGKDKDKCSCDSALADDNDAKKKKKEAAAAKR